MCLRLLRGTESHSYMSEKRGQRGSSYIQFLTHHWNHPLWSWSLIQPCSSHCCWFCPLLTYSMIANPLGQVSNTWAYEKEDSNLHNTKKSCWSNEPRSCVHLTYTVMCVLFNVGVGRRGKTYSILVELHIVPEDSKVLNCYLQLTQDSSYQLLSQQSAPISTYSLMNLAESLSSLAKVELACIAKHSLSSALVETAYHWQKSKYSVR